MPKPQKRQQRRRPPAGWDPLANWYDGWVGAHGSDHHQKLAIPAVIDLLDLKAGETVLDIGAGQGVLAPYIAETGASYTGVEISPRLQEIAQKRHTKHGRFVRGDARQLATVHELEMASFDAAVFLLSIQDMNPLDSVLASAGWALKDGGRLVILMTHPCFRIPRQSGWEHDENRDLRYRRIDSYLTPLSVPLKQYGKNQKSGGVSISFHRPLGDYVNGLAERGMLIDRMDEITTYEQGATKAERSANEEIPLFMGLRARKLGMIKP